MSFRVNVSKFSTSLANHICFRPQHNIAGWTLHRDVGRSAADDRPLDPAVGRVLYGCPGKLPTAYGARCNICGWAAVFKVIKFCFGYSNIRAGLQLQNIFTIAIEVFNVRCNRPKCHSRPRYVQARTVAQRLPGVRAAVLQPRAYQVRVRTLHPCNPTLEP